MAYTDIIFGIGGLLVGVLAGLFVIKQKKFNEKEVLAKAEKLLVGAKEKNKEIVIQARADVEEKKKQFAQEEEEFVGQLNKMEQALGLKIASYQKREDKNLGLKKALEDEKRSLNAVQEQVVAVGNKIDEKLIQIVGIPPERMKDQLLDQYENAFKQDAELRLQHELEWVQECSLREGKNVLEKAICRYADSASSDTPQKTIIVPRDEIKGRIVGRGGSNIAFFENLFTVDVIFNDEPNIIIISCFNLVQREIACAV